MKSSTIAVHGATGTQGAPVVRRLLDRGHTVRPITRHAGPDLTDVPAMAEAYRDVNAVVLQLPLVFDPTAVRQAETVLAALDKADVPRVVFNTSGGLPETPVGVPFIDARALLRTELPAVVDTVALLAPVATYAENLSAAWSAPLVAAGEVRYPLPAQAPIPWVTADDVAAVVAELVTAESPTPAQLLAGPEDLTGTEVAARLSNALGHPVEWRTITPAEYEDMLRPHLGPAAAAGVAASYAAPPSAPDPALIRRGPTALEKWARSQHWR